MKQIKTFLKNRDNHGHTVTLGFNGKGPTHNTKIGGIVTLLSKLVIISYIYALFTRIG